MSGTTLIGRAAVAQRLGTTERHIRRLVNESRIPYVKVGGLVRFDQRDIEKWIARNRKGDQ